MLIFLFVFYYVNFCFIFLWASFVFITSWHISLDHWVFHLLFYNIYIFLSNIYLWLYISKNGFICSHKFWYVFYYFQIKVLQIHCHCFSSTSELFRGALFNIQVFGEFLLSLCYLYLNISLAREHNFNDLNPWNWLQWRIWSILVNIPCVLENNIYFAVGLIYVN